MSYRSLDELKEIAERRNQDVVDFLYEMVCDGVSMLDEANNNSEYYLYKIKKAISLCREYQYHDEKWGNEENVNYQEIINVIMVPELEEKTYDAGKSKGVYL